MKNYLWVKYDSRPPNLPEAVAESAGKLAIMVGTTRNNILSSVSKYAAGVYPSCPYRRVAAD